MQKKQLKNSVLLSVIIAGMTVLPCFATQTQSEIMFTAKKFLLAMLGVAISSILIFVGLTIYNKLFHNPKKNEKSNFDENSLEPAKDIDSAISNFLNRTKM